MVPYLAFFSPHRLPGLIQGVPLSIDHAETGMEIHRVVIYLPGLLLVSLVQPFASEFESQLARQDHVLPFAGK